MGVVCVVVFASRHACERRCAPVPFDIVAADDVHDMDRYRSGCRCETCRAANRDYMRVYRAERRGLTDDARLSASVSVLPAPAVVDDVPEPGPVEQGLLYRCSSGDLVAAARKMPDVVASCLALARIMDDYRQVTTQPSAHRQYLMGVAKLEAASVFGRRTKLAAVAASSQRRPSRRVV